MDILRGCIEILINEMPYDLIDPERISKKDFCLYAHRIFPQYSDDEIDYIYDYQIGKDEKKKSVFDLIEECSTAFLVIESSSNKLECKKDESLRWRQLYLILGQDLFTTAFYAINRPNNSDFTWKATIDMQDSHISKLSNKEIAENHFHLNGSIQIFPLSFACVMNNIGNQQKQFKKLTNYFHGSVQYNARGGLEKSLYEKCVIAAAIRLYLFTKLSGNDKFLSCFKINENNLYKINASNIPEIDRAISVCKSIYGKQDKKGYYLDYTIKSGTPDSKLEVLSGERYFLYMCYRAIQNEDLEPWEQRYFYSYLVIKSQFRNELIQTNKRVGFRNFSDYQDRKDLFISGYPQYERAALRLSVNANLDDGFINWLEARITPKNSSKENKQNVNKIDKTVMQDTKNVNINNFYYVLHFPKATDIFSLGCARHSKKRIQIYKQARAIYAMLDSNNKYRKRVRGIDACSNEIGCRPEVYAPSFRYLLSNHTDRFKKLHATYHVGEEFLDIADGLRAIDEVLTFIGLGQGDRLGHALALGINALEYYIFKKYQLIMSKQDAIDNFSWVMGKANDFKISMKKDVYDHIDNEYRKLIKELYSVYIPPLDYYEAWQLRGDEPSLYQPDGWIGNQSTEWTPPQFSRFFWKNPNLCDDIRIKYGKLYYKYHFDYRIKTIGSEKYVLKATESYAELMSELQQVMITIIKQKGIGIEINPSSNVLIGTFNRYDEHPIFRFVKVGHRAEGSICASINTDDLGVFDTSLQNEYVLLSTAMTKTNKYNIKQIRRYLEKIRKFGIQQRFE